MAYIDREELEDYPFTGYFYRITTDDTLPLTKRVPVKQRVCDVICDIQEESNFRTTATAKAVYGIYIPYDSDNGEIPVRRGDSFTGSQYGILVSGKVIGVFASQIGTFENYTVKDDDVVYNRCRGYKVRVEAIDV